MQRILIEAESFETLGGWVIDQQAFDTLGSAYLMAHGMGVPVADASTRFTLAQEGRYTLWARTRDWTAVWEGATSAGRFEASVDGYPMQSVLGVNGAEWAWQRAGEARLCAGEHVLSLHDLTGFNGRVDALYLTSSEQDVPPNDRAGLDELRRELVWREVEDDPTEYDLVIVGGGVAGICMALAAKRTGTSVLLINDREVLGGCNSSEIRVCMGGMLHMPPYERLGDIVKEIAPIMGDPNIFPGSYYEDARKLQAFEIKEGAPAPHKLALGERVLELELKDGVIHNVTAANIRTGKRTRYHGRLFADCTGDATLARLSGCEVMYGREGRDAFGEDLAAPEYQKLVMGHSLRWYSEQTGREEPFPLISWGVPFTEDTCYHVRNGDWEQETGFTRDMVSEVEYIRDYGLRAIFSNWNYQKNLSARRDEYRDARLVWISPLGGKRESYRVVGDHILTEQDIETPVLYDDATACMTWSIDIHFPEPDNQAMFGEAFRSFAYHRGYVNPYPVPYRCLYARDVKNLFLGGRVVSTSHVAFSAIRVMRTLGALGEVAGLAAGVCRRHNVYPRDVYEQYLPELKEALAKGAPSPDSFNCSINDMESYHFKDIGWLHLNPYHCDTPEAKEKFTRNIKALGMKHKYSIPKGWEDME